MTIEYETPSNTESGLRCCRYHPLQGYMNLIIDVALLPKAVPIVNISLREQTDGVD